MNLITGQGYDIGFSYVGMKVAMADELLDELFKMVRITCKCVCAVPRNHPFVSYTSISAADLDGQPMGTLQLGHATVTDTQKAFDKHGAQFNVRVDAQYFLPLFNFVEAEQICAIVDPLSAKSYLLQKGQKLGVKFVKFEPTVPFGYALVTPSRRPPSLLAKTFAENWLSYVRSIVDATDGICTQ